jgi:hypothetical protein
VAEAVPAAGKILTALAARLRSFAGDDGAKEASRV